MGKPIVKKKKNPGIEAMAKARAAKKATGGTVKRKSKKINLRPVRNLEEGNFNVLVSANSIIEIEGTLMHVSKDSITISHKKSRSKMFITRHIPMKDVIIINGEVGDTARVLYYGNKAIFATAGEFELDAKTGLFKVSTLDGTTAYVNQLSNTTVEVTAEESEDAAAKSKKKNKKK